MLLLLLCLMSGLIVVLCVCAYLRLSHDGLSFDAEYEAMSPAEKRQIEIAPRYTSTGIQKMSLPHDLRDRLKQAWGMRRNASRELDQAHVLFAPSGVPSYKYELEKIDPNTAEALKTFLQKEIER